MRRGWILLLLLAALALPVSAADVLEQERQILQVDSLTDPLSGQTREALEDYSPASQTDPASAILDIFKWASNLSVGTLREAVQTGAMLLTAALICQLVRQAYPKDRLQLQSLTGAFAITALFAASMKSMIGLATGVLDEMEAYAKLLLPVMCGAVFQPPDEPDPRAAAAARLCVSRARSSGMRTAGRAARQRPHAARLVHFGAFKGSDVCVHGLSLTHGLTLRQQ